LPSTINLTVSALRFFFTATLDRPDAAQRLKLVHQSYKPPVVPSPEEVSRLLEAVTSVRYKAALSIAYGAGLRVSEIISLKVSDIDSERMLLRVEHGKGGKTRHAMLSPQLLELLRDWWRIARPQGWLFPGQDPIKPMTSVSSASCAMLPPARPESPSAFRSIPCAIASPPVFYDQSATLFICGAERALHLLAAHAAARSNKQIDRIEPSLHRRVTVLKDRARTRVNMVAALRA
jgi:hypothetical protein